MDDLIKIADEEAEEIGDSHYEHKSELPVTVGIPEDEIRDLPWLKRKRERPPTTKMEDTKVQVDPPDVQLEVKPEEHQDESEKEMEEAS